MRYAPAPKTFNPLGYMRYIKALDLQWGTFSPSLLVMAKTTVDEVGTVVSKLLGELQPLLGAKYLENRSKWLHGVKSRTTK